MSQSDLNIVIMAGGTGGHVFPALAVAEELRQRGVKLSWLGTARGIEAELVPAAGIPLHCLTIEGVRGKGLLTKLKAPFLLVSAVWEARSILKREQADAVLGLGGFASGPGGVAAWLLGKPVLIHEQNAVAGTTNRWLARLAQCVMEAFPGSLPNAVHVGNPVRKAIAEVAPLHLSALSQEAQPPLKVLVLGGSLGALALNEMIPAAVALLADELRPEIKHQTGKKNLEFTEQQYQQANVTAEVLSFIDDMAAVYEWADVVICRAGALTVSELTLAGRGALLVPYPYAIDDHQTHNAQWLENNGAGLVRQQKDLSPQIIADFIRNVSVDREQLMAMSKNARALAMPDAAKQVASYCEQAARGSDKEAAHE
ncbi:undecaprenyldiphospho-muramoylpentapeptide beta-N-acetylglucosaminyltransferase [Aestuariicella hydrocarbonica]|uniref:UDP-N-acetylglucosamine--N-acetylmuramyl-(pentapeptide) pyrophosphoryl-undecaprenol N-acetylglucosamine transferase n=1 Tax=Pseudomaricurvus hydrocarbonicus TaxID=1470433 RepID=A0A9E5JUE4_9GAMM|nr:undecaprenyldiphospho-muramoylpentapeptide beta-N-acetylglucosaminyltransferase [Aestuariicella hydrocarbonica]NHO65080.1 undecaprenyldiphospho-muramoylpentapeptide beta-N-acetylglucosaminyltransferase [Aestuariicella hydrocarbonica]